MPKKELVDFTISITAKASSELIDNNVLVKAKKLIKDLEGIGVEVQSSFVSSGHILGGSLNLVETDKAKVDGTKG